VTITGRTQLAAVIGSPVRHSLSPVIHNAAFRAHDVDWVYTAFEVPSASATAAIDAMRVFGMAGLSITMPHKELVMPALDAVDEQARVVRAVNTVVRDDSGRLIGHNTDGIGSVDVLRDAGAQTDHVAVVGAGATARAVIAALAASGARVLVANRSADRLADAVKVGNAVRPGSTSAVDVVEVGDCRTIVNATPLGMAGVAPGELPFGVEGLGASHCVLDVVYHPLETPLVREARRRGCQVVDGLDMLCAQAARQQELWLGHRPRTDLMRAAALDELAKSQR